MSEWEAACKNEARNATMHQRKSIELQEKVKELEAENKRLTELKEWLFTEWNKFFTAMDKLKL